MAQQGNWAIMLSVIMIIVVVLIVEAPQVLSDNFRSTVDKQVWLGHDLGASFVSYKAP